MPGRQTLRQRSAYSSYIRKWSWDHHLRKRKEERKAQVGRGKKMPTPQIALRLGWSFRVTLSLALSDSANKNTEWPVKFEF